MEESGASRRSHARSVTVAEAHQLLFDSDESENDSSSVDGGLPSSEESDLDGQLAGEHSSSEADSDPEVVVLSEEDGEDGSGSSSDDDDGIGFAVRGGRGGRGRGNRGRGRGGPRGRGRGGRGRGRGGVRGRGGGGHGRGAGGHGAGGRGAGGRGAGGRGAGGRGAGGRGAGGRGGGAGGHCGDAGGDAATGTWKDLDENALDHEDFQPSRELGVHLPDDFVPAGPLSFFRLFFSVAMLQSVVQFTNLYAAHHVAGNRSYGDKYGAWRDTNLEELDAFIGLVIFMGFCRLADMNRYWSRTSFYKGLWARRFISSHRRFKALLAYHHIVNPHTEEAGDKLKKIRSFYDGLRTACQTLYQPRQELSVDERMVKSKARVSFKQYIKNKPVRWGFKLFTLCCSTTGYLWNFKVYTGKEGDGVERGLAHDTVVELCEPFAGQGYEAYFDQFYTSPALAKTLLGGGIRSTGTCQVNRRDFPAALRNVKEWDKRAHRGDMRYVRQDDVLYLQWKDKRTVTLVSTMHSATDRVNVTRHTKVNGEHVVLQVPQPAVVDEYNRWMGGVDVFDQMVATYRVLRKTWKWWKTLFFDFIDIAVVNAYILYQEYAKRPDANLESLSHLEFRETLARQLANIQPDEPIPEPNNTPKKRKADYEDTHPPGISPSNQRRNCVVCYRMDGVERKTRIFCRHCTINAANQSAYLCLTTDRNCWDVFHSDAFNDFR